MNMKARILSFIAATLLAAGCGGSSGSTPAPTPDPQPEATVSTGILLDSPVAGISYRTETKKGVTNAQGEYAYLPGETVTFFIGGLEFPPVTARGIVTPADMAGDDKTTQTNILQILQTLDSDGDPENGITIHEEAAAAFAETKLDLAGEAFDAEVASVLESIGGGLVLVTEADANAHFEKSLSCQILGSWDISEGDGNRNVLTFIDEARYLIIHEFAEPGENQPAGSVEYGTYSWDTTTGAFAVSCAAENDADGFGGLWDEKSKWTRAVVRDNTLTLHLKDDDDNEDVDLTFARIPNPVDALTGSYILASPEDADDIHVLTVLSGTEYVIAHTKNDGAQPLSGEFGTYTHDPDSRHFKVTGASVNADGEGGLYNAEAPEDQARETMFITASGSLIFSGDSDEDPVYFKRISNALAASYQSSDVTGTWYSVGAGTPNENGTIDANSFTDAGTLTVQSSGDYRWETRDAAGETDIEEGTLAFQDTDQGSLSGTHSDEDLGWFMNAGKDVMTLIFNETEGEEQGTVTFVKAAAAYTAADLTGSWHAVGLGTPTTQGGNGEYSAEADTLTVAEDGSYEWRIDDEKGTLSISPKGKVSSSENPEETVGCFLNARKDVLVSVFNDTGDEEQGTTLLVKAASACTLTDLTGVWHSTAAATPNGDGSVAENTWAEAGTVIIDAAGKYHWRTNGDEDRGTLTVSTGGVVSDGAPETLGWYLSAGKDVMILVFNDTGDNEQGIITFVKQP